MPKIMNGMERLIMAGRYGTAFNEVDDIAIDSSTNAQTCITYAHHEIHGGSSFSYSDVVDLANGAVRDIQIETHASTKWAHLFFNFSVESETEWYFYENVALTTPGAGVVEYNSDRNSGTGASTIVRYIDNTSVANANSDTDVSSALTISHGIAGAGKSEGSYDHGHEIILKQAEFYSVRFVANAAGYVSYHLDWYEHTSKH